MKIKGFFSVPNLLCYLRIILIPIFLYVYIGLQNHNAAIIILIITEITDFLDGLIARKCNMVTDWGKIIDPIADKLLQLALLLVLITTYPFAYVVLTAFILKEAISGLLVVWAIKLSKEIEGARFWGKVSTFVFYIVALVLVVLPQIKLEYANSMLFVTLVLLMYSFIRYVTYFIETIRSYKE